MWQFDSPNLMHILWTVTVPSVTAWDDIRLVWQRREEPLIFCLPVCLLMSTRDTVFNLWFRGSAPEIILVSPSHFFVPVGTTVQLSLRFGGFSSFFSKWSRFDGFPWVAIDRKFLAWPHPIPRTNAGNHHRWPHWQLHWLALHFIRITSSTLDIERWCCSTT